jgi:hypothetical protein
MYAGRSIVKGVYDHATGQFAHPQAIDPSEYIAFSGLHALALDNQRRIFDLKIFLDPDDDLRQQWKAQRDERDRGYAPGQVAEQLARRQPDRLAYILPQRETADLVLRLMPARPADPADTGAPGLALEVRALNGYDLGGLAEALEAEQGMAVDLEPFVDHRWQALRVAGCLPAERVRAMAEALVPNLGELCTAPVFAADLNGVVQLVVVLCLAQKLRWSNPPELD